jgi:hypothetical protein
VKKTRLVFLITPFVIATLTGCGMRSGLNIVREIPLPETYTAATISASPEEVTAQTEAPSAAPAQSEGTFKAIDEIKDRATASGYEVEELLDFQKSLAEGTVGGFNVIIGDSHIPVMEFTADEGAQAYADMINEAGYNIAVVNGRFLTMVSASDGIVKDKKQQQALEDIMDAKAQVQDSK